MRKRDLEPPKYKIGDCVIYKKEIIKEVIGISATIALGIIVMFGFMLVFPD